MGLSTTEKVDVVSKYQQKEGDTGSPEVQVALLKTRIVQLTEHFKEHKNDNHSRRGLLRMVNQTRTTLDNLKGKNVNLIQQMIDCIGLRA